MYLWIAYRECTDSTAESTYTTMRSMVALAKYLDTDGRLPATFMVVAPGILESA